MTNFAIFFDRDGIVNDKLVDNYVRNIGQFKFLNDFFNTFKIVKKFNFLTFLVTNQQGIGKNLMSESDLREIHEFMNNELINQTGSSFDEIYFCPSLETENDFRRKPNPGMILEAIEHYNLDKNKCIMIGDSVSDVLAGNNAGIQTILVNENNSGSEVNPTFYFHNLYDLNKTLPDILYKILNNTSDL